MTKRVQSAKNLCKCNKGNQILSPKNSKNFFLHSKSKSTIPEKVNIILSPELYWVRIFVLPMENEKEVLHVMPSLFEEFIDIENKNFYVKKLSTDRYLAFAYDESLIIETIKNANIELGDVNKIYFSQIEFLTMMNSLNTSYIKADDIVFSLVDDILVKIPSNIKINTLHSIDIEKISLSKESISINSHSKYVDNKTSKTLSILFAIVTVLFIVKTFINYQTSEQYAKKVNEIKKSTSASLSNIQLKSITKKYERLFVEQVKIRELFEYVLNIRSIFQVKISSFSFENKTLKIKIDYDSKNSSLESKIQNYLQKKYKKVYIKKRETFFLMEVKL